MQALEVLRQMHVEAKHTFEQIERADISERVGLWAKLRPELVLHEKIEERFVYDPAVNDVGDRETSLRDWHHRHHEEMGRAEQMIDRIGDMDTHDTQWLTMVTQLRDTLLRHIEEEEQQMWPLIERVWGMDKLEDAGGKVQAAKTAGTIGATVSGAIGGAAATVRDAASGDRGHEEHAA
jgi:hypothetical protein